MEAVPVPKITRFDINAMLRGTTTESLIGALPHSEKTIDEYRAERLEKYDRSDRHDYYQ